LDRGVDDRGRAFLRRHIRDDTLDFVSRASQLLTEVVEARLIDVADEESRALSRERDRNRACDPAGGSGNDRHPVSQSAITHLLSVHSTSKRRRSIGVTLIQP
jgi:hypothetical protein